MSKNVWRANLRPTFFVEWGVNLPKNHYTIVGQICDYKVYINRNYIVVCVIFVRINLCTINYSESLLWMWLECAKS